MSTSEFVPTLSDETTLDVIRRMHDWAAVSARGADLDFFIANLAETLRHVFGAKLVAIWDHNHRNGCLVLQASSPGHPDISASRAIAVETSMTGLAVERRDIISPEYDILEPHEGRCFTNPPLARSLGLKRMLSIPVFNPNDGNVGLVINLCYGADSVPGLQKRDIELLVSDLSIYVQHLVNRREEKIMSGVRAVAAASKGILPLFDALDGSLRELTRCRAFDVFRWDEKEQDLYREAPADVTRDAGGYPTRWLRQSGDFDERFDAHLVATCVGQRLPLIPRFDVRGGEDGRPATDVYCPAMAVPIQSSADEVIGVIRCRNPEDDGGKTPSFSSFDLLALESFSRAAAPSVERFLRLREGGGLMHVVKDVSRSLGRAYKLDASLQKTIETLVESMHSKFGSIYLRREGTDVFYMRAATEPSKHLIGRAKYKVGEGITGSIASGELINFRSREEMRDDPRYAGRYHREVYGEGDQDSDTLLGIPIFSGDDVIGLWKVENVQQTDAHPDPYYTDEDEQVAQVISQILGYVITNDRQERAHLRRFIQLTETTTYTQRASDEDAAIRVVMTTLGHAGFGALLSLYDAETKLISANSFAGSTWTEQDARACHIGDDDIRAYVLRTGREEFIKDSAADARCRNNPLGGRLLAQLVIPLRLGKELIGALQIDVGEGQRRLSDLERLTLRAFVSHLTIAISRWRVIRQTLTLTEQVLQSSRFTIAEALSGMAVHHLNHKLSEINTRLENDLARPDIRSHRFLYERMTEWQARLRELESDLKDALRFVRAPVDDTQPVWIDLHAGAQAALDPWFNYLKSNKCLVRTEFAAERANCVLPSPALREIMAVLVVNAVQAHAGRIEIRTYNSQNVRTAGGKKIRDAVCLEFSDDGQGLGLDDADHEKIFEPTYTTKPGNIGTGLGLFVARRLARRAHGDLEVAEKRRYAKGATFRLSLPVARELRQPEKGRTD